MITNSARVSGDVDDSFRKRVPPHDVAPQVKALEDEPAFVDAGFKRVKGHKN